MGPAVARLCVGHAGVADDTVEEYILRAEADYGDLGIGACSADAAGFGGGLVHGLMMVTGMQRRGADPARCSGTFASMHCVRLAK